MLGKIPPEIPGANQPRKIDPTQTLFENFFEFSPDAIVVIDGNGRIAKVNAQVEKAFGYMRAELLGLPVETLMPERYRAAHRNHRETYTAHPSVRQMGTGLELYGRRKNSSEFPIDIMLSPVETADGPIFLSVIRDVTEKKRAEENVRQSEGELRQLIDAIPQQVFVFNSDWSPLFANRRELEYTGLTSQEMQSKDAVARIFHPDDLKKLEIVRKRALSDPAPFEMEARIRGKDGQYRWFLVRDNPLRDQKGRVLRWYGTRTDIEDRKRAEEKVRQSETELRQLIDAIPQQVFVFNPDWSPLFANRQELDYTGLTQQEVHSKDAVARIVHPEDLKKLEAVREQARSNGAPFETEARIRGKDGHYRWFLIRDNPLRDEQGRVMRWYGTRTDIEDQKRAEEASRKAQADLAHVTRIMTMGEFAASIAHEVNQPLTGVIAHAGTCSRWLAAQPPDMEQARRTLGLIVRDGNRAIEVIGRIRALTKKAPPRRDRLNINTAILEVIALTHTELQRDRVELRTNLSIDLPLVPADRVQLQQVILNLIVNAMEAMSGVGDRPRELVVVTGAGDANDVFVEVRDSGLGLDPANLSRLFDSFYTTKPEGMGMGLSISRSIIEAHGGRLWATPNQIHGAVFRFTLPVEDDTMS
jgi:PAS domain S-box-containing protein